MWGGCLFHFRDQTLVTSATDQSLGAGHCHHCLCCIITIITLYWGSHIYHHSVLRLSSLAILILRLTDKSNYKMGSQDDRKSSTNQNLDHSFLGKMVLKMVLIPGHIFSHCYCLSVWTEGRGHLSGLYLFFRPNIDINCSKLRESITLKFRVIMLTGSLSACHSEASESILYHDWNNESYLASL